MRVSIRSYAVQEGQEPSEKGIHALWANNARLHLHIHDNAFILRVILPTEEDEFKRQAAALGHLPSMCKRSKSPHSSTSELTEWVLKNNIVLGITGTLLTKKTKYCLEDCHLGGRHNAKVARSVVTHCMYAYRIK